MNVTRPRLGILPPSQLRLWPELQPVGHGFVLYLLHDPLEPPDQHVPVADDGIIMLQIVERKERVDELKELDTVEKKRRNEITAEMREALKTSCK